MLVIGPGPDYESEPEIVKKDEDTSLIDEIRQLKSKKQIKYVEEEPVSLTDVKKNIKTKKKKKKEEKAKKEAEKAKKNKNDDDTIELLDVESFIVDNFSDDDNIDTRIVDTQKRGYDKLKRSKNEYKKEFSEELTLLYNLLSEVDTFGKELEKDLKATKGNKVRGVTKYSNDLAELVLNAKQNKLNILKEIAAVKKTTADLKLKAEAAEAKDKKNSNDENNTEFLASAYLKNILNYGRNDFVSGMVGSQTKEAFSQEFNASDNNEMYMSDEDDDQYFSELESRLEYDENPYRSEEGNKYIEYENRGVQIFIKKCIDTGEWEFIALDKTKQQIYDYPVPRKRDVGKVKFSDDGTYGTDSRGRMYKVIDYLSPDDTEDYDD